VSLLEGSAFVLVARWLGAGDSGNLAVARVARKGLRAGDDDGDDFGAPLTGCSVLAALALG
jgi:hypothetical protein